jgi:hypothetical protein
MNTITGYQPDAAYFRFAEYAEFDPARVLEVLQNRLLGVMFRGVIGSAARQAVSQRFWDSQRTRRREDAPSYFLGSYSYDKSASAYLDESAQVAPSVAAVLGTGDGSPWHWFRSRVADELRRQGMCLRTAAMDGRQACPALIRSWDAAGEFSLRPHEDMAQCLDPRQAGFEVQRVAKYEICAVNICLANGTGGRLVIWNIQPDSACRKRLGMEFTGYPYPVPALAEFSERRIDVRPGDLYVFNGSHVHAVEANQGTRTNLTFFMGFRDAQTVITWT